MNRNEINDPDFPELNEHSKLTELTDITESTENMESVKSTARYDRVTEGSVETVGPGGPVEQKLNKNQSTESDGSQRNIRLTLEFDGTDFNGWQAQEGLRTVQTQMEKAIFKTTGETVRVTGCSRTDAGVHARNYVMNFYTSSPVPPEKFRYPLNAVLPPDIRVLDSREADPSFHARKHARRKTYSYAILNSDQEPAIGRQYVYREKGELDEGAMREVLGLFLGTHDFSAFRSTGSSVKTATRTIHEISLDREGDRYTLRITGDGFLYNMVRIIAGTLLYVGHGTRTAQDVQEALETGDRHKAGKVAPARGLTLETVEY